MQHVIAEHDGDRAIAGEVSRQSDGVRNAERTSLVSVGEIESDLRAVVQQLQDVADRTPADNDHHLPTSHLLESREGVEDHRPIVDRQQMLVGNEGEREQARAAASCQNDPFEPHPTSGLHDDI